MYIKLSHMYIVTKHRIQNKWWWSHIIYYKIIKHILTIIAYILQIIANILQIIAHNYITIYCIITFIAYIKWISHMWQLSHIWDTSHILYCTLSNIATFDTPYTAQTEYKLRCRQLLLIWRGKKFIMTFRLSDSIFENLKMMFMYI